jgi:NADPH-dependent 2,4-dienoyl-CoA reductase/sulfur reductase-like enzyme
MRLVIIGGVAAGATAAARARRISEEAEIVLFERGPYVSYANCGLPYYISRDIEDRDELLLQTPEGFKARYGVEVRLNTEVVEIDLKGKRVLAQRLDGTEWISYDKLILGQGGSPIMPRIPGSDASQVFRLWTIPDMDRLHGYLETENPRSALVVGGGFIGLEMAEAFRKRGLETTVVELQPSVMGVMDPEFGRLVGQSLEANGVKVLTRVGVSAVLEQERLVELSDGRRVPADVVLFSVGVRPELTLAKNAGLEIGK